MEEADKIMSSNTYLAARMLTQAKDVASRISKMEVSYDQALSIILKKNTDTWTGPPRLSMAECVPPPSLASETAQALHSIQGNCFESIIH